MENAQKHEAIKAGLKLVSKGMKYTDAAKEVGIPWQLLARQKKPKRTYKKRASKVTVEDLPEPKTENCYFVIGSPEQIARIIREMK